VLPNFNSRAFTTARHRLMVISAKGGVGKSTITVNLAAALKAHGLHVGIFDADVYGPNIPALLGVNQTRTLVMGANPEAMLPIEARPDALDMRPIKPFERYDLQIMSLGLLVGERQALNPEAEILGKMVTLLLHRIDWGGVDVLLLDMPPNTGEPLGTILSQRLADAALLVTTRERLAHLDNGRLVSLLNAKQVPMLGVVENMTHMICPKCGELIEMYPALTTEQDAYKDVPVLAAVPFHPHLIRQRHVGAPLPLSDPDSPAAIPLLALADEISARLSRLPAGARPIEDDNDCEDCP
jgi:ATP-binding protein involved in chromosome partitioning